jgi:hypothetical protein
MANTDFNPDSYIATAKQPPAFNPDTYIADNKVSGILPNFAAGFGEGVTGGLDLLDRTMNPARKVADIFNSFSPTTKITVPDQAFYNHLLGKIGLDPDSVEARTLPERLSRYAGQGSTALLVPGAGEAGVLPAVGRAVTGAVSSMAGGTAAEYVSDRFKPIVGLFASLAAGIPFSMGLSAAAKVPAQVRTATTLARAGVSPDIAEQTAGKVLAANATDVKSVKDMLARGVSSPMAGPAQMQTIPGSQPTTFQATGDMGLGSLERATATKNPELFRAREADQNAARITALGGIQSGANPTAVADYFRTQLRDLDTQTAAAIEDRLNLARQTAATVGGDIPPETLGQTMRDAVATAEAEARQNERGLWNAVDPNGDLTGNVKPTSAAAESIADKMRATEKPMSGEEAAVFEHAKNLPDVAPVADLIALRSRVSTAMRDELTMSGRTPSYARLVQLRGAIQDNLAKTISDHAVEEAPKITSGEISPDASITARIAAWRQNLEADRDRFLQQQAAARAGGQTGVGGPAGGGTIAAPGAGGTGLPGGGGPGGAPGTAGLPGNAPTFDAAAAARLAAATAATKQRATTYGNGPVGQILRQAGGANLYRVADAGVPAKLFHSGPTAFQDAQGLANAVGPDRAAALLTDAAAASLRKAAMTEDGYLDPRRVMLWQAKYADALRALPEPVRQQFMDARNAAQAVAEATLARADAMKAFQAGRVGQLLGVTTPQEVANVIGQTFASPQAPTLMKGLADAVRRDPDAAAGLRQAVADYIAKRFISNTEVATSGQSGIKADAFQTFVKQNEPALRQVFSPAEIDTMKAIADDIRQAKRSQNAVRLVGGSNTAQDTAAQAKQASILGKVWQQAVAGGAAAGMFLLSSNPVVAGAAFIGTRTMQALREAGIANVDDLVTRAMLDPVLARRLLEKAPVTPTMTPAQDSAFAKAIRRSIAPALAVSMNTKTANGTTR